MNQFDVLLSMVKFLKSELTDIPVRPVIYSSNDTSSDLIKGDYINVLILTDNFNDAAFDTRKRTIAIGIHVASADEAKVNGWLTRLTNTLNTGKAAAYVFDDSHRSGTLLPSRYIIWNEREAANFSRSDSAALRRWFSEFDVQYSMS